MELYSILRWIFLVCSAILILVLANKCKKKALAIICGFAILIGAVIFDLHFPLENNFVHFKTAQQAFSYYNNGKILNEIDGKNSTLIIYKSDNEIGTSIIPKKGTNWQINPLFSFDTVCLKSINSENAKCNIVVFQAKNTKDFYVNVILWFEDGVPAVSDNRKSVFCSVEEPDQVTFKNSYSFYGYVEDISNEYQIQVNGETIEIKIGENDFSNATSK